MYPRLITSFSRLGESEFLKRMSQIVSAMTDNAFFPTPWPAPAPGMAEVSAAFERYRLALDASTTHDTIKILERQRARDALTDLVQGLAAYLGFVAQNDEIALQSTGFELRRTNSPRLSRSGGPLPAPEGLHLSHGVQHGEVDLKLDKLEGASSYEVQTTQGDPNVEDSWHHALLSVARKNITLSAMTPMQWVWVRVRGFDSQGAGRWSEPASIVVL
ncbi:fibronectin type III domain-containing protein [Leptothrix ochracea]|uniref:fibronectin type III domain-containing protein n=1 Tax=Leptothrix ochracea TaxID=735331 RepID=UPI0034E26E54